MNVRDEDNIITMLTKCPVCKEENNQLGSHGEYCNNCGLAKEWWDIVKERLELFTENEVCPVCDAERDYKSKYRTYCFVCGIKRFIKKLFGGVK